MPEKLVTFDFWDTLFLDDSDEPKRKNMNLPDKNTTRKNLLLEAIQTQSPNTTLNFEKIAEAFLRNEKSFRLDWLEKQVTWTVPERLKYLLENLAFELKSDLFDELVHTYENMEVEIKPDPFSGIRMALDSLSQKFKLGIISDTIYSPGRSLKKILNEYDLLKYFNIFIFSDEKGYCKPDPRTFKEAAKEANIELKDLIHIGDREPNDIIGPKSLGARAVLITVSEKPRIQKLLKETGTQADLICEHYEELPKQIEELIGG